MGNWFKKEHMILPELQIRWSLSDRANDISITGRQTPRKLSYSKSQACPANALIQCLYSLKDFKRLVKDLTPLIDPNQTLYTLKELFLALDKAASQQTINQKKVEFLKEINATDFQEILGENMNEDSGILFQKIVFKGSVNRNPTTDGIFKVFCQGDIIKTVLCNNCPNSLRKEVKFTERLLMLNVQADLYYQDKLSSNFFQSETEKRFCENCQKECVHQQRIELTDLPQILVLKIEDDPLKKHNNSSNCKPLWTIELITKGVKRKYKFAAAIYHHSQGENNSHSIAYVRREGEEKFLKCYNDLYMNYVSWKEVAGSAKLTFYCQEN